MARRTRRNPEPIQVVATQLGGAAERCVIRGPTEDQTLVEFGTNLAALSPAQRKSALDYATARYVDETTYAAAEIAALLARAGADLARAEAIRSPARLWLGHPVIAHGADGPDALDVGIQLTVTQLSHADNLATRVRDNDLRSVVQVAISACAKATSECAGDAGRNQLHRATDGDVAWPQEERRG